jgi:T5SS/PEP-CTERM-associated repeat protein
LTVGLWIRFELVAILLLLSVLTSPLSAAIVQSGNVEPNVNHWNFGTGYIGRTSDGSVLVDAGSALTSSYVYVGYNAGTAGTATVEGAGSKWVNTVSLNVGYYGNGSLAVAAGGQVSSATSYLGFNSGSTGVASVTGPGSRWTNSYELNIGGSGNGTLTVADGGVVITGSLYASLDDLLGNGSIIATGGVVDADLLFDAAHGNQAVLSFGSGGTLKVNAVDGVLGAGYKERGSMTVREGVDIRSSNGNLGFRSGSTGTAMVEGVGSSWSISNSLYVGRVGSGSLTIENGGQVGDTHGFVGYYNNSTGAAVVTGAGSQWTNGESLQVGVFGSGSLTIEAGGQVNNNNSFLGYYSGSTGTVAVTGIASKWTNRDGLFIGYNARGDDHSGHGELSISSGGLVTVAGVISISSGDFLNIATGGMLALAGNADDSLTQFLDLVSGTDSIRYWDASLADWSLLTNATYGEDYSLEYLTTGDLAGYTLLTVGRVGDFDNDGDVDGRDFLAWQRNPELGNLEDWQNAYGNNLLSATAVPEPNCLALLLGLMVLSGRDFTQSR